MGNLIRLNGAYLRVAQSRDSDGLAFECKKLDGVAVATLMHHDNCPDVACFQAMLRERLQQHNPVKLLYHLPLPFLRICGHEARNSPAGIYEPDYTYDRGAPSRCFEWANHCICGSKFRVFYLDYLICSRVLLQRISKLFPTSSDKAKATEEHRFASSILVGERQKIRDNFRLWNDSLLMMR